ncbi:MAG TPA: DNA-3-methyladenine glycosylase [Pseudonocardiaceae bacterium]|nr:DNA-3-methyladenine glycosylase [Pseudonocardiaceae bacterium]
MTAVTGRQLTRTELAADPLAVARLLLGALIVTDFGEPVTARLVEVEAYRGFDDPAAHTYRGKTDRNAVMFGPAGFLYVYFVYGMHFCANVVTSTDGVPGAVLMRAGEVVGGLDTARARRPASRSDAELAKGPARLTAVLGLDRSHNGIDMTDPASPVRLYTGAPVPDESVRTGPRVGVATAMEVPWRWWVAGSPAVSTYRRGGKRRIVVR